MKVIALYPGSFDPVTNGHVDITTRAAKIFSEVVVAVYDTPAKDLWFSTQERLALFQKAVERIPNVQVVSYTGLTVDFARKVKASVIVRGLRMGSDFEREFEMALMNQQLRPDIETVAFMSNLEYQFLSASLMKEVCQLGGDVSRLVPRHVAKVLQEKLKRKKH